jgi:SAM-dependent methyltransferase
MTTTRSTASTSAADRYRASPPELYEQYFVPRIGRPCAELLVEAARPEPGDRVIDVACGTGAAARLAAHRIGPNGTIAGIDVNPGMLAVAGTATPVGTRIDYRQASADGLPFDDDSFDVALCSLGLQFFADKIGALREMRRVLAPHGRSAVGVPGPTPPMFAQLREVLEARFGLDVAAFVDAVFAVDDPERLASLLSAAGFSGVDVATHHLTLPLDPPADFLWQYMLATPLAMVAADLGADARRSFEDEVVRRWQPYLHGDGLSLDVDLHVATATTDPRPGDEAG